MDELESGQWACDKCTYINDQNDLTCVMCYTVRTATKDIPVTWQWQAADQWIPYDLPACLQIEDAFKAGKSSVRLTQGWFASNHGYTVTFQKLKSTPSIQRSHSSQSQSSTVSHSHSEVSEPSHSSQHEHEHDDEDDHDDMQQDSKSSHSNSSTTARTSGYRFFQTNTDSGNVRKVRRLANDDDSAYITLQPSQLTLQDKCGVCQEGLLGEDDDTSLARAASNTSLGRSASGPGSGSGSGSRSRPSSESGSKSSIPSTTTASPATTAMTRTSSTTSSPSSLPIVKLPKCDPGHAFHRDCIAQWLKLKDHCPFCQKRI